MTTFVDVCRFENRTRASVKNLHVFPFVAKFGVLAHRIEMLLTIVHEDTGSDARETTTEQSENPVSDERTVILFTVHFHISAAANTGISLNACSFLRRIQYY